MKKHLLATTILAIFLSLTSEMKPPEKKKLITEATFTALAVSLVFLFGGRLIFNFLGITENDFRVGGGIVLLVLAVIDLTFTGERNRATQTSVGVVPIGIPLIIGPAVLTTLLIVVDTYGYLSAVIALLANPGNGRSRIESVCKSRGTLYGGNSNNDDSYRINRDDYNKVTLYHLSPSFCIDVDY